MRSDAESSSRKKGICWRLTKCFELGIRKKRKLTRQAFIIHPARPTDRSTLFFIIKLAMYIFLLVFLYTRTAEYYIVWKYCYSIRTRRDFPLFFIFVCFLSTSSAKMRVVNCLYIIFIIVCCLQHQYDTIIIII